MGYGASPPAQFLAGATATVADGGTITHGWYKTPAWVVAVGSVALNSIAVTAIAATTFTVSVKVDTTGAAGTAQTIYWMVGG
jgi:hypothetical protein